MANRSKGEGSIYQHTDGRWMFSIMHEGKRLTKSLGTRDREVAMRNYQRVRNQFMGRIDRGDLDRSDVNNFTIGELLANYLAYMQENGRKSADMVRLTIGVIQRDRSFLPTRRVATLTTQDFRDYRRREVQAGVAQRTINYRFALIRAAFNLEKKQTPSKISQVPHIPFVAENNTREGFLEYDDHIAVLSALPQSLKALFVVAVHSGCRKGELLNMRWSDVDWKNSIIRLPQTKSGKKRNLPFWGGIEPHLHEQKSYRDQHHAQCEHLFFWMAEDCEIWHGGIRIKPGTPIQDFRASWADAVKQAHQANSNVKPDLLFHDLRRSAVRAMVQEAGIPESQAMLISGHETRTMLERYNIVSLKNVQDAGAKLDAWSRTRKPPAAASDAVPTRPAARARR
jgi:integrase